MMKEQTMEQFHLTIDLGNEAMQDAEDVAFALRALADRLMRDDWNTSERILDTNGQSVGVWSAR